MRQLGLTAQQEAKVSAIFAASMAQAETARLVNKINGPFPAKEQSGNGCRLAAQSAGDEKIDRMQIDAILTRQQAVLFKKLVVPQNFFSYY